MKLTPIFIISVLLATIGTPPASAQDRAFNCAIEWKSLSGSPNRSVLQGFIAKCRGTPAAAAAQAEVKRRWPPAPPPPGPEAQCKARWTSIASTRNEGVLRSFVGDCGHYRVGQLARDRLRELAPRLLPVAPPQPAMTAQQLFDRAEAANTRSDYAAARRDWLAACNMQMATACNNLGTSYSGTGTASVDVDTARYYWDIGCKLRSARSCDNSRMAYSRPSYNKIDLQKAAEYFDKTFSLGTNRNQPSIPYCPQVTDKENPCRTLARHYRSFDANGSTGKRFVLYLEACNSGEMVSCGDAGELALSSGNVGMERILLAKACDNSIGQSCFSLSHSLNDPRAGAVAPATAQFRMKQACDLRYQPACDTIKSGK